jgi:RNA polymerase sigma-70 factor (ECF subfamily)
VAEDRELVDRLRRRDRDALRRIYEKYKDDLLTIAACMLADRADAEDCLHDVFVSLSADSARVRPDGNLKGYLVTSVANRSRDRLRRRKRRDQAGQTAGRTVGENVAGAPDPAAPMIQREECDRLYRAIAALPIEQRTVITLRLHGEMTFDEIARREGVSGNTIRSRYRYGLEKLRTLLGVGVKR